MEGCDGVWQVESSAGLLLGLSFNLNGEEKNGALGVVKTFLSVSFSAFSYRSSRAISDRPRPPGGHSPLVFPFLFFVIVRLFLVGV